MLDLYEKTGNIFMQQENRVKGNLITNIYNCPYNNHQLSRNIFKTFDLMKSRKLFGKLSQFCKNSKIILSGK